MAYELKPGQGSLFKNDRKKTDRHPDWQGSININGTEYWLSAWDKVGRQGARFFSLSLGKEKLPTRGPESNDRRDHQAPLDSDVPF